MKCFVIAMNNEAAPVTEAMTSVKEKNRNGKRVIYGKLYGEKTGVIVCGVGKVNAACGTQFAIDEMKADAVINLGVAGGLNGGVGLGKVYAISHALQYDFDLTKLNGTEIGTLDECSENYIPLCAAKTYPLKRLATGDRFNDDRSDYKLLTKVLKADIRDMEGGAVAQVCMHAGVKCYGYKIISDIAGAGSTTEQYLKNLSLCFSTLKRELENIFALG